jgi:hypothetical protein
MPGSVYDPSASQGDDPARDWVVPAYVNDAEFTRNNRLFCDFIHRGILPVAERFGKSEQEEIVAYV